MAGFRIGGWYRQPWRCAPAGSGRPSRLREIPPVALVSMGGRQHMVRSYLTKRTQQTSLGLELACFASMLIVIFLFFPRRCISVAFGAVGEEAEESTTSAPTTSSEDLGSDAKMGSRQADGLPIFLGCSSEARCRQKQWFGHETRRYLVGSNPLLKCSV
ncbi:hypothetical protein VTI74DRAFT_9527 [Chaetomium olivicolor]